MKNEEFLEYYNHKNTEKSKRWDNHDYEKAIIILNEIDKEFDRQEDSFKSLNTWCKKGLYYDIACAFSLLKKIDNSLNYLEKSINFGYNDYYWFLNDEDLNNIRNTQKYNKLLKILKEKGDYEFILLQSSKYSNLKYDNLPKFTYQSKKCEKLQKFKNEFQLDLIAGNGNDESKIINLMEWVNKILRHDGNSSNPTNKYAREIINLCKKEKNGVNCRMIATVLNEVYLAMGYNSRMITCMPKDENFDDCHVINIVYLKYLRKWVWMDATFNIYLTNIKDELMSIEEVRLCLTKNEKINISNGINWNGNPYPGGANKYLYKYMVKNLYRFSCPIVSEANYESGSKKCEYIELLPINHNLTKIELSKKYEFKNYNYYYIDNQKSFWVHPNEF